MSTGSIKLEMLNVHKKGIADHVLIELRSLDTSDRYRNTVFVERTVDMSGIAARPMFRYEVTVWPSDYRPSRFFVFVHEGRTATREPILFPVDPDSVAAILAPEWSVLDSRLRELLQNAQLDIQPETGETLYQKLDDRRKACLLNVFTKAGATALRDGSTCADHLHGLIRLRGDRLLARTGAALREEVQNQTALFRPVSDRLHHPPDGYLRAGSFKTRDRYGNLQLSFFRLGETGDHYLVDADIDEAAGIEHGFEIIRNRVGSHTTDPYDIREILIRHQEIDPGYDFEFAPETVIATSERA